MLSTKINSEDLSKFANDKFEIILLNTYFKPNELNNNSVSSKEDKRVKDTEKLIYESSKLLKNGGLFFIYGLPKHLPLYGSYLEELLKEENFVFKYWIGIEFEAKKLKQPLPNSHIGLLMYLKTKSKKNLSPFHLNTKTTRTPYKNCKACGQNLKDWGGKKHLMNKLGTAISDVWLGPFDKIENCATIPKPVFERLYDLTKQKDGSFLIIEQNQVEIKKEPEKNQQINLEKNTFKRNQVILGDSIELLKKWKTKYPEGVFDLAFADPPYNLAKEYEAYKDEKKDEEYLDWCNQWMQGMLDNLRPGGALLVLNIPKWAIHHATFLLNKANFRHWIVWDALSTPAGKLMPAHYALLYFTKPGGNYHSNFEKIKHIDSREYCNRHSCEKQRKHKGDDNKEILSDIWWDIFRIKHKKDRDTHPCQLPVKLMERIILLTTKEGDLVFDPFAGAGTTAIAAKLHNRDFIVSDIDEKYVQITKNNLKKMVKGIDGKYKYFRESRPKGTNGNGVTKKYLETTYIQMCKKNNNILELEKLRELDKKFYSDIVKHYPIKFSKLQNICKRQFETEKLIK